MFANCVYILISVCLTLDQTDGNSNHPQTITGLFGRPVAHMYSSLTVGLHGPTLMQDMQYIEEISHFNRERIPERGAHAKGSGAFGEFRVTNPDITKYSKADFFKPGKATEVAVRFSIVTGESGTPDTVVGEARGFAIKFYTDQGNFDLLMNNVPVFFIRDPRLFTSLAHAIKRNPQTGLKDLNAVWDFISHRPEALNVVTYLFTDMKIPDGCHHMPGFAVNVFKFVNSQNKHFYARFHWIPDMVIRNLDLETAGKLAGSDPDYCRKLLFQTIEKGEFPSWTLKLQIITEEDVKSFPFNPFDVTKYWPMDQYPMINIGRMTLNRNPNNFFADVEQLAFNPGNLVPGIETSPDPMLGARFFPYSDAQIYRLGTNYHLIPVNMAKNKVNAPLQRDGQMRTDNNGGNSVNYYPNSYSSVKDDPDCFETNFTLPESVVSRYVDSDDNYGQPRDLYNSYPKKTKDMLHTIIAVTMQGIKPEVMKWALDELGKVDHAYAEGVRSALNKMKH